jgi:hypothetical protein
MPLRCHQRSVRVAVGPSHGSGDLGRGTHHPIEVADADRLRHCWSGIVEEFVRTSYETSGVERDAGDAGSMISTNNSIERIHASTSLRHGAETTCSTPAST